LGTSLEVCFAGIVCTMRSLSSESTAADERLESVTPSKEA